MTDDNELDPLARLRAADPAADVEAPAGFAAQVVAEATGSTTGGAGHESADQHAPVAEIASARARRRRLWLPIAAVAASVVVFGGAGFAIGAGTTASSVAGGAAAPVSLQGGGAQTAEGRSAVGSPTAGQKIAAPGASDQVYRSGYGRNSFTASGLSTSTGTARAYGFDARAASDATTVGALAKALGIDAAPALKDGSWQAGPQDGTAPSLTVGLDGTLSFFFSNPALNPMPCVTTDTSGGGSSEGSGGTAEPCTAPSPSLPAPDAAIAALRSIITASGRDAGAFEFTSETPDGAYTRSAQAWPVIDGQRIDQSWSVELTTEGIVSASGALAPIVSLGDYPVVSAQQAFERLSDPRFGAQQTVMPLAMRTAEGSVTPTPAEAPTQPPALPSPGVSPSWPVNEVHIVKARLGLASQWQPDGSVLVLPAYELTDADGGTWSVIAVADAKLDFATE
ncbi:hypothetical protein [Leifsonia sp. 71-9]|uniref:hypothetical protein n=1 Tax=Leifsonia sp. 71-9 TaxID=1895934 RepID=UPI000A850D48|nr:hypothetical protein [Leifsonia sp. 71-9]